MIWIGFRVPTQLHSVRIPLLRVHRTIKAVATYKTVTSLNRDIIRWTNVKIAKKSNSTEYPQRQQHLQTNINGNACSSLLRSLHTIPKTRITFPQDALTKIDSAYRATNMKQVSIIDNRYIPRRYSCSCNTVTRMHRSTNTAHGITQAQESYSTQRIHHSHSVLIPVHVHHP